MTIKPLRILITNWTLAGRHGSVMYVRDLAASLFRRGQLPMVYAPDTGEVARELQGRTIPVADSLAKIAAAPDIIIGNTQPDLMAAMLRFPGVPGLFICHQWDTWLTLPPRFPRIRRYIAVDETCRDWLTCRNGIPEDRVRLIYNAVDLDRFVPRDPLPERPRRAAVFSNYIDNATGLAAIREACRRMGIELDVLGRAAGTPDVKPEDVLGRYDLVFGKARCALEAMAVGCAVVLCDYGRLGGIVTSQNWADLRRMNFGRRAIRHKLDAEHLLAEIAQYSARDAREVMRNIREVASLDDALVSIVELARDVIQEQGLVGSPGPDAEMRAVSEYLCETNLLAELTHANERLRKLEIELEGEVAAARRDTEQWRAQALQWQEELQRIYASPAAQFLKKMPGLGALAKRYVKPAATPREKGSP